MLLEDLSPGFLKWGIMIYIQITTLIYHILIIIPFLLIWPSSLFFFQHLDTLIGNNTLYYNLFQGFKIVAYCTIHSALFLLHILSTDYALHIT